MARLLLEGHQSESEEAGKRKRFFTCRAFLGTGIDIERSLAVYQWLVEAEAHVLQSYSKNFEEYFMS